MGGAERQASPSERSDLRASSRSQDGRVSLSVQRGHPARGPELGSLAWFWQWVCSVSLGPRNPVKCLSWRWWPEGEQSLSHRVGRGVRPAEQGEPHDRARGPPGSGQLRPGPKGRPPPCPAPPAAPQPARPVPGSPHPHGGRGEGSPCPPGPPARKPHPSRAVVCPARWMGQLLGWQKNFIFGAEREAPCLGGHGLGISPSRPTGASLSPPALP